MKFGYSILLGESMNAVKVEYHDCEHFQIVCPSCREPVFKAVREGDAREATHYLSHYAASKSQAADCDLRVAGLSLADIERQNAEARDQRLRYFWSKLRGVLSNDPIYGASAEKVHWRLNKSTALRLMREHAWDMAKVMGAQSFDLSVDDYLRTLHEGGWGIKTSFSLEMQKRIARDMWISLCTPPGRSIFEFLFNHSFLHEIQANHVTGHEKPDNAAIEVSMGLAGYMAAIAGASSQQDAQSVLHEIRHTEMPDGFNLLHGTHEDSQKSTVWSRILGNVTQEMVGRLIAVPYFELLRSKYGDSTKSYPLVAAVVPVSKDEKRRAEEFNARKDRLLATGDRK